MKTKQTKIDRSAAKWLPGAMALAATTASSQAATVQITLTGNKLSSTGGNQLNADLTGDSVADITVVNTAKTFYGLIGIIMQEGGLRYICARYSINGFYADAQLLAGGVGREFAAGTGVQTASYLNRITFTDSNINGGAPTDGWLQVNAFNTSVTDHTVELSRLIFDDASTTRPAFASIPGAQTEWQVSAVPEPATNLGLLALGAGGLTLRRRLRGAA